MTSRESNIAERPHAVERCLGNPHASSIRIVHQRSQESIRTCIHPRLFNRLLSGIEEKAFTKNIECENRCRASSANVAERDVLPESTILRLELGPLVGRPFPELQLAVLDPAVLKVADLGGVMGLDAGFRSASRSVAGRASPVLWWRGSALAGGPGVWCRRAALRPAKVAGTGLGGGRRVMRGRAGRAGAVS